MHIRPTPIRANPHNGLGRERLQALAQSARAYVINSGAG